jgi:hypothetical protein
MVRLRDDVQTLNSEANWSDFYYSDLEAEVEVDPSWDLNTKYSNDLIVLLERFYLKIINIKYLVKITRTPKIEKNLVRAIERSRSHAFLIIGDPGSGKTVSLRHLFLRMANSCISSKDKTAICPIYLNLKHLNLKADQLSDDAIHEWIINQLRAKKDRSIYDFIDKHFEKMLNDGHLFFLFDSFDEIPSVMDAQQDQEIVKNYAKTLGGFIHSYRCKGLVSSRPYRAPKVFIGQKMIIRPLSDRRIRKALDTYLQEPSLTDKLWHQLSSERGDILHFSRNPFYLGLLAGYVKNNKSLPERHYTLFEFFVENRAKTDESRLKQFNLTPTELIQQSSILAYAITRTPNMGLEANIDAIYQSLNKFADGNNWDQNKVASLLNALAFSKLGKLSSEQLGDQPIFGFVHRRFQEYFCARYIRQHPQIAPIEQLAADDRWREVLVLLCEVLPNQELNRVFDVIRPALSSSINANPGSNEYKRAIEIVRFLRDGFRSRIDDIPGDIRILCSEFILRQIKGGDILDQKRALEALSLINYDSVHFVLDSTLRSNSDWLRETAIRSCRILQACPQPIAESIRMFLYHRYVNMDIYKDYSFYSVLFSTPALWSFRSYFRLLLFGSAFQFMLSLSLFIVSSLKYDLVHIIYNLLLFAFTLASIRLFIIIIFEKMRRKTFLLGIYNPWIILTAISYMSLEISIRETPDFYSSHYYLDYLAKGGFLIAFCFNFLIVTFIGNYPKKLLEIFTIPFNYIKKIIFKIKTLITALVVVASIELLNIYENEFLYIIKTMVESWSLARAQEFSIVQIYSAYGLPTTIIILATMLIFILYGISAIIAVVIVIRIILYFISDQIQLRDLSMEQSTKPKTTKEAAEILHKFKTDFVRILYIRKLHSWLPNGDDSDSKVLKDASLKYHGTICDEIFKLLEIWEDSRLKSRNGDTPNIVTGRDILQKNGSQ